MDINNIRYIIQCLYLTKLNCDWPLTAEFKVVLKKVSVELAKGGVPLTCPMCGTSRFGWNIASNAYGSVLNPLGHGSPAAGHM